MKLDADTVGRAYRSNNYDIWKPLYDGKWKSFWANQYHSTRLTL